MEKSAPEKAKTLQKWRNLARMVVISGGLKGVCGEKVGNQLGINVFLRRKGSDSVNVEPLRMGVGAGRLRALEEEILC